MAVAGEGDALIDLAKHNITHNTLNIQYNKACISIRVS